MNFAHWIKDHVVPRRPSDEEKLAELMRLADEIQDTTTRLQKKMRLYARSRDPFAALLADVYNQRQIDNIYRGSPNGKGNSSDE